MHVAHSFVVPKPRVSVWSLFTAQQLAQMAKKYTYSLNKCAIGSRSIDNSYSLAWVRSLVWSFHNHLGRAAEGSWRGTLFSCHDCGELWEALGAEVWNCSIKLVSVCFWSCRKPWGPKLNNLRRWGGGGFCRPTTDHQWSTCQSPRCINNISTKSFNCALGTSILRSKRPGSSVNKRWPQPRQPVWAKSKLS